MFFGLFGKKEPPILRANMLEPVDALISTAEAKRIFKTWMIRIGHFDQRDASMHIYDFAEAMKGHEAYLKEEIAREKDIAKDDIAEEKDNLKEAKRALAKCKDESLRAELQNEVESIEQEITSLGAFAVKHVKLLDEFKKDKRAFLVDYINEQVNGK